MSRDLSPAELCVCRVVFGFLAVMIFCFLLLKAIEPPFDQRARSIRNVEAQPDTRSSGVRKSKSPSPSSQNSDGEPQKGPVRGAKSNEPVRASPSILKVRLEQLGAANLKRMVWFDSEPLQQREHAPSFGLVEAAPQPVFTESPQASEEGRVVGASATSAITASANPAQPLLNSPQELKASASEDAPSRSEAEEASATVQPLTEAQAIQIKTRLRDLGFLSSAKSAKWDAGVRNALRDFKVVNNLSNDDNWDIATRDKLNAQTAVRANHSIIGDWSTAPCRSSKPTDTRLSISSRRSKSSTGGVCEFHDLKVTAREWRVKATCSQEDKHWTATGKFSLIADKLVWTSGRDVISYFRCR